jgi:hypothetical protein
LFKRLVMLDPIGFLLDANPTVRNEIIALLRSSGHLHHLMTLCRTPAATGSRDGKADPRERA